MTNSKSTKRALVTSVLSVFLCITMLIGTTFAWFTDTASTSVNKIQAGTLKVDLEMATEWDNNGNVTKWESAKDKTLNFIAKDGNKNILWEPGCTYNLPELRIANKGNLALKYKVVITGINGDAKLNEVIKWTIGNVAQGEEQKLAANKTTDAFTISGTMETTAGNAYQGLTIEGISITVYATQDTVEYDSDRKDYDADAVLPKTVKDQPELNDALKTNDKYVSVALADGTYKLNAISNKSVTIYGTKDTVIDMTTSGIIGAQNTNLDITFDGMTVKFANEDYKGITHSGKVTYTNCVIEGKQFLYAEDVEFINCTFINNNDYSVWTYGAGNVTFEGCTFISGGKAILIYIEDGDKISSADHKQNVTVNNCVFYDNGTLDAVKAAVEIGDAGNGKANLNVNLTVTNNTIYGFANNDEGTATGNKMWGNKNSILADRLTVTASNNTEIDGHCTTVFNAAELKEAVAKNTEDVNIVLVDDITVTSDWTPIDIGFYSDYKNVKNLTIDGNGCTISNLPSALVEKANNTTVTIKNLTVKNANISNSSYVNGMGNGIFVGYLENGTANLTNCHVVDSNISESSVAAAALIGYSSNITDKITITGCTVKGTKVVGDNAAGFVGYVAGAKVTVSDCKVTGSTFTGGKASKQGAYFGTVNSGAVVNIKNTTADTDDLVGRTLSNGVVNYD